jgi:short-subunit dehydrogenase
LTAGPDRHKPRPLAVITGASSGIGAEFARALAARGYDLLLTARRRDRLEDLAQKLGAAHPIAAGIAPADLRLTEEAERLAERISQESRLEVLVNNAGFGLLGDFPATRIDDQIAMYQVHVLAPVRLTHAALPGMLARNRGGIINVASVAGFARVPGHASYNATKSWMIAFTECLHLELRRSGSAVRIQALCPGYTYTEFHDVLGLDRRQVMPGGAFWMPAEFVVAESLEALDKGAWLVVPGWRYKVLVWLLNTVPRAILDRAGSLLARRREQAAERFAAEGQAKPPRKT